MTEGMKKIVFTTEKFFNHEVSEMCVSDMIGFKRVDWLLRMCIVNVICVYGTGTWDGSLLAFTVLLCLLVVFTQVLLHWSPIPMRIWAIATQSLFMTAETLSLPRVFHWN